MKNQIRLAFVSITNHVWDGGCSMTIMGVVVIVFQCRIVIICYVKIIGLLMLLLELTIRWIQIGCSRSNGCCIGGCWR